MILTNPGEIVLFKVNNTKGFYAIINNLVADPKKGWWIVTFSPLIGVNTTLQQVSWILDDSHIRGKEFIINKVTHQICKVDTTEGKKTEEIQKQKKIYDFEKYSDLSFIEESSELKQMREQRRKLKVKSIEHKDDIFVISKNSEIKPKRSSAELSVIKTCEQIQKDEYVGGN